MGKGKEDRVKGKMVDYKAALYRAALDAYKSEVIDTEMASCLIGEGQEFSSRKDWIESRVAEWLDPASSAR